MIGWYLSVTFMWGLGLHAQTGPYVTKDLTAVFYPCTVVLEDNELRMESTIDMYISEAP